MHEALAMVRHDLGPEAAVLHTREVQSRRFFGWLSGPREIEVTASRGVNVPSRLPGESDLMRKSAAATRTSCCGMTDRIPCRRRPDTAGTAAA